MTMKIEEKDFAMAEEMVSQPATKTEEEKRKSMENLIEKAKKGNLSVQDLDEAIEEVDFDAESMDKFYETLEDHGIAFDNEISTEEMNEIEHEVEKFGAYAKQINSSKNASSFPDNFFN